MTTNVRKDLGLQSKLADCLTIQSRLFRGGRGSQLDVFNPKGIQGLSNGNFGFGIEECVGKLFSLSKCALNNVEI